MRCPSRRDGGDDGASVLVERRGLGSNPADLPTNQPGARRVDDRRVISGILHVLKTGCRWRDCPKEYGPHTTIYNRFNRWSRRRLWLRILEALVAEGVLVHSTAIDSTYIKAHRSAHGGKGGRRRRPSARHARCGGSPSGGRTQPRCASVRDSAAHHSGSHACDFGLNRRFAPTVAAALLKPDPLPNGTRVVVHEADGAWRVSVAGESGNPQLSGWVHGAGCSQQHTHETMCAGDRHHSLYQR
jgi:transposase